MLTWKLPTPGSARFPVASSPASGNARPTIAGLPAESLEPAPASESRPPAAIPEAFREVIAALDLPAALGGEETDGRELNG